MSKHSMLERNEAFSAEIILCFIRNKGKLFAISRIQSVQEALDTATERDLFCVGVLLPSQQ